MDLRYQSRVSVPTCFVCRYPGKHIIVWPLRIVREPLMRPNLSGNMAYTSGSWNVFLDVHEVIRIHGLVMRSKKIDEEFCADHWFTLREEWESVIANEVNEYEAYYNWLERTQQ